jgi:hypothetical protein
VITYSPIESGTAQSNRPFRWYDHHQQRHGIPLSLDHGDAGETVCHLDVEIPNTPDAFEVGTYPVCAACEKTWKDVMAGRVIWVPRRGSGGRP